VPVPAGARLPMAAPRKITVRPDRAIIAEPGQVLGRSQVPVSGPQFERISDITNMVPV
jgi:hypothetical protein